MNYAELSGIQVFISCGFQCCISLAFISEAQEVLNITLDSKKFVRTYFKDSSVLSVIREDMSLHLAALGKHYKFETIIFVWGLNFTSYPCKFMHLSRKFPNLQYQLTWDSRPRRAYVLACCWSSVHLWVLMFICMSIHLSLCPSVRPLPSFTFHIWVASWGDLRLFFAALFFNGWRVVHTGLSP